MKYLTGQGSIFYGGEEYVHPGGRKSEAQLAELWAEKLKRKNVSVGDIMNHACAYRGVSEGGHEIVRFVRSEESDEVFIEF